MGPKEGSDEAVSQTEALAAPYDWLQFNGDARHTGNDAAESTLGAGNVGQLALAFQVTLPSAADGAPVLVTGMSAGGSVRDLLFVTTKDGHLIAIDAHTGATVWSVQNGPGTCKINNGSGACDTTSSPAIDPGRAFVYTYGLDGAVHKYGVGSGTEVRTGGWPETASLKGYNEKSATPLTIAKASSGTTYLYVGTGGYPGDNGDYQGHVTTINLATGAQTVFNAACSDQAVHFVQTPGTPDCSNVRSAVWARSGVVYDSDLDRILVTTGNGTFDGVHQWGDSALELRPDGTSSGGTPLDSYTPTNFQQLQDTDADLGSTAPAVLPALAGATHPRLAVQGGKDGKLRLLNLDDLSGQGGPGKTGGELQTLTAPGGRVVVTALAVSTIGGVPWIFVATGGGIAGIKVTVDGSGTASMTQVWSSATGGTSPVVANGVLYYASSGALHALAPTTGQSLFTGTIGSIHWESPIVANGVVYVTDENAHLSAFAPPATPSVCDAVAENQTLSLACPSGQVVTGIDFASYGTPTGACGGFVAGSCNATSSTSVVSGLCLGKASCSVLAGNSIFGDPCVGTVKRLDVQAQCSAVVCGTSQEHAATTISCPAGQTVRQIVFASYGTPTGACSAFATSGCNATTSTSIVTGDCIGLASCSVQAENSVFGDPCFGTFKHLDIEAACGP